MFNSRYFLHNLRIIENNYSSCKYSNHRKVNFIKQLNLENKILYGSLLETRKQRRKSIEKNLNTKSEEDGSLEIINTNLENETLKLKGCQKRGRKSMSTDVKSVSVSKDLKGDINTSENIKKVTKKVKSSNSSPNSKEVTSTSNEFVFKSNVPINDVNYPLENPTKSTSCDLIQGTILNYTSSDSVMKYCVSFPSVSKIMEETMSDKSKSILAKWKQNMINNLGQEGFSKYFEDLKSRGHNFHSAVCNRVLGKPPDVCSEVTQNALKSLEWMLKLVTNPIAVESLIAHPTLEYKGIPDCVLHFRGIPVVVDWKLSDKTKKSLKDTYDAPIQVTSYIGALNHDPNYKWTINHGLVVVAYTNGDPCDVFLLAPKHCHIYWRHWLMRCDKFKARNHLHTDHVIDEQLL